MKRPLDLPVGKPDDRSTFVSLLDGGKHTFRLTLREKPGCVIASVTLSSMVCKTPRPALREELQGRHPRLLITSDTLAQLRARLADPRVQRFYKPAAIRNGKPPAFKPGANGSSFRTLHDYALSYLLEPRPEKLKAILRRLEAATAYPDCGVDLDAEYFLEGVALCYDWLYEQIPAELRGRLRDTLLRQGAGAVRGFAGRPQRRRAQFPAESLLVFAPCPGAGGGCPVWRGARGRPVARLGLGPLRADSLTFSPDGSFHEGPGYWSFSMPTLYLFTDLYECCTALRIPAGDRGLMGQGEFRFHYLYPGLRDTAALEDSVAGKGSVPIAVLLWEAKRFKSPVPMGIATRLAHEPGASARNLLWLDEHVPAADVEQAVPRYYHDVETGFARTSWSDDATYVAMVSRPLGGHVWSELCQRFGLGGTGHNHPEQNHFVLFGRGEILVGDTGYTYDKQTRDHNTILVDGKGQYGDGQMWPEPSPGSPTLRISFRRMT